MVRLFIFLLVILGLGWGFSWLADRPGIISITWQDQLIETSVMVAATMVVALVAIVMLLWWIIGVVWTSPHSVRRYFRARKRDRGYQALSTGLIAAGAGNAIMARKMSLRTRGLLSADQEPLIHLLEAQAALIEGRHDDARRKFEQMADDPETRELGLRGLYMEAAVSVPMRQPGNMPSAPSKTPPTFPGRHRPRWKPAARPVSGTMRSAFSTSSALQA